MTSRTTPEILAKIEKLKAEDFFGFATGDLISYLSFEEAKPFLKEGTTAEMWGAPLPRDHESVKSQIVDYMPFAWDKANNCRGISASRSISHMGTWLWMLGLDEASEQIQDYDRYGKPQLRQICEHFGVDWRALDDGEWRNDEMQDGGPPPESVPPLVLTS